MAYSRTMIASTALLALAACGRSAEPTAANTTAMDSTATNVSAPAAAVSNASQTFANMAAASDNFEIETSKLALTNGASASVKAYASKMIDVHTSSTAKLKAAAASVVPAVVPNPMLNAEQQQKLDQLKSLNGTAFDQAYIAEQAAGHQQTLDTLKGYVATGDAPALKAFATSLVPIVTAHLNMVKGLKA